MCRYVARQIAVKRVYRLWVTKAERAAMARVLKTCPDEPLPRSGDVAPPAVVVVPTVTPAASPTGTPTSTASPTTTPSQTPTSTALPTTAPPTSSPPPSTDPRFPTCAAAKAAGYGPYYRGVDPEYAWYRDADDDGIVCE